VDIGNFDTLLDLDDGFALFEDTDAMSEDDEEQRPDEEEIAELADASDLGVTPELMHEVANEPE
jgi:hypothetical protein